ncbi:MAG: rod-binding protein [Hyphomicrobiaceae bacterium]|nr:rod-binding protein [Hyphomicrobiaceae bacterium]
MATLATPYSATAINARPLPSSVTPALAQRMRKQATDFEQSFLNTMLQEMFTDVPVDGLTGGGHAEEQWRGLLIDEYAKTMSGRGGVGVADMVYSEMLRLQETSAR